MSYLMFLLLAMQCVQKVFTVCHLFHVLSWKTHENMLVVPYSKMDQIVHDISDNDKVKKLA